MAVRRATASAILLLVNERAAGIRVSDISLEEDSLDQVVSEASFLQEDDGFKMFSPLEAEALAEVQEHIGSQLETTQEMAQKNAFIPKQLWALRQLKRFMKQGKEKELQLTCEQIQQDMFDLAQAAAELLTPACQEADAAECDNTVWHASLDVDNLLIMQNKIVALATVADKKMCLPEAMPPAEVTSNFLQSVPLVHEYSTASTSEGKERLQEAYLQLVSFQQGFVSFADEVADRKTLLSRDIDEETCQSMGCGLCDRHRSSVFGFRCLLKSENDAAKVQGDGKLCSMPKKRGFTWFRRYDYETQCTVLDWKQAAVQQVQLSAAMSCASTVLAVSVRSEVTPESRQAMYTACMEHQQSGEIDEATKAEYTEQLKQVDDAVSRTDKAVAGLVLAFGQVSGLAALRASSRFNPAAGGMMGIDQAPDSARFTAPFEKNLLASELAVREEDVTLYVNQGLLQKGPVEQRLEKSRAAQLQGSTDIVTVGLMPLVLFAMENRGGSDGATVAEQNSTSDWSGIGRAMIGVGFAVALVVFLIAVQVWVAHLITMALLSLLTVAGVAKVILYVLGMLFIGLPISNFVFNVLSRFICAISGRQNCGRSPTEDSSGTPDDLIPSS